MIEQMMAAINEGDVERVNKLLEQSDEFRGVHISGQNSILSHAIFSGNVEVVKALVGSGAQLEAFEIDHYIASQAETQELKDAFMPAIVDRTRHLSEAVNSGNLKEVQAILKEGGVGFVDPDMRTSILAAAAVGGNVEIVQALVAAGATVEPGAEVEFVVKNASAEAITALGAMIHPTDLPPTLLDMDDIEEEPPLPPARTIELPVLSGSQKDALESKERRARIAAVDLKDPEVINKIKKFVAKINEGFWNETVKRQEKYMSWNMIEGVEEFEALNGSDALSVMNQKAIADFETDLNELIGNVGVDSKEYANVIANIIALNAKFLDPNRGAGFAASVETELTRLQVNLGIFYAKNPDLQKHIPPKKFIDGVQEKLGVMCEQLNLDVDIITGVKAEGAFYGKLTPKPELMRNPIEFFRDQFSNIVGDRGRESPEYKALSQEINALHVHFDTQLPGTAAFSMVAQTHINNIQSLMGQFYANNPDVQQHVSIKGFVESISKISKGLLSKFTFDKPLASHISLVLEPIAHAAATGKMERHDSALKNAEDCKYLAGIRSKLTPGSQLAEDVAGSVGKFNVLDKFKLAEIINEDPDRVVRYIQSLEGKGTPATAANMEAIVKMLDMFTTEATKQKMAYIVAKLEGKEEAPWDDIASHISNAMEAVKRGVESVTGYNDITDAMNELGIIYNIYGSLFKGESVEVADKRATGFVGRMFAKSEGVGNVDDLRELVDGLIGDNGRGSAEYKEFLVALASLRKENPQYKDNAFQNRLNDVSKAIANLYVSNPAVQQHVSLRDFSEGVSKGVQALADGVKNTSRLNVVGSDIKPIESNAKHILIKSIAKQPIDNFNSYGGDARKIDAHNYLAEQKQEVPGVGDAMKRFEAKDNFKLAELINKNPERVMRVIEEMSKQGLLLTKIAGSDEGVEKVATVLNYLSSDETKENMATILNGLKSDAPVLEFFAQVAVAIEKGINWLTGFDKEVEAAFKEINNIAVMQHDVIAKYEQGAPGKAEIEYKKKEGVKSFVERVSKPSVQGQEIS